MKFRKIMIFGRPGSGKSTFALEAARQLQYPLYHLDKYFYTSYWQEKNAENFMTEQQAIVAKPCWIVDGNSTRSLETRWQQADLVLYFNFNRWLCLLRVIWRFFVKNSDIDDRAENCPEVIRWSLIKYLWDFERRVNPIITQLQARYPQARFAEIKNLDDLIKIKKILYLSE